MSHTAVDFANGRWNDLIRQAVEEVSRSRPHRLVTSEVEEQRRRGKAAQNRVERGQVSRARQELTGASLAPRNEDTMQELQRKRPQERRKEIPAAVLEFIQEGKLKLSLKMFANCVRSAPSGSSPGPGGRSNEMLRVLMEDKESLLHLHASAKDFARADVPQSVHDGQHNRVAEARWRRERRCNRTSFWRLVAMTLARQFGTEVEAACAPFQFTLSTRAGVDCVGHAVRAATDADPMTKVLSVDGTGAHDRVYRAAMMSKLLEVPSLRHLLPFVRQAYGSATSYSWRQRHRIHQEEGGEQGDPLMPMLFCLAIHDASAVVKIHLVEGQHLFAFLDDIYVLYSSERTTTNYIMLANRLETIAGIQLHEGKTRVWNRAGVCSDGVVGLGPEVWGPSGAKILGTPVGSPEFVRNLIVERLGDLLGAEPSVRVADTRPLRSSPMPPLFAHSATKRIPGLRAEAR